MVMGRLGREAGAFRWVRRLVALAVVCALLPACQVNPAQFYIPLAYALTGVCIALLMSPTPTAAVVGAVMGAALGAAVYNNSIKRQLADRQKTEPRADSQPQAGPRESP
jgi:glycerol uptake facilitator-like aquaporin